ncbi:MAG: hypothetical protein RIC80_09275 [Cyclobacteriaceae bacterium]
MEAKDDNKVSGFLLRELQAILTLSYGTAVGVGMLFQYQKFSEFGINIFDYADVFDFLIAPFSDMTIILFALASVVISLFFYLLDGYWFRKWKRSYFIFSFGLHTKPWYPYFKTITFTFLIGYYLYIGADLYGQKAKEKIVESAPVTIRFVDNETMTGQFIGKTREVIFLAKGKTVKAVPIVSTVKDFDVR